MSLIGLIVSILEPYTVVTLMSRARAVAGIVADHCNLSSGGINAVVEGSHSDACAASRRQYRPGHPLGLSPGVDR